MPLGHSARAPTEGVGTVLVMEPMPIQEPTEADPLAFLDTHAIHIASTITQSQAEGILAALVLFRRQQSVYAAPAESPVVPERTDHEDLI